MSDAAVYPSDLAPARKLADLLSIIDDLRLVESRCDLMQRPNLDPALLAAVWEALVVAYYRSFATGKSGRGLKSRRRLHAGHISRLDQQQQRTHALMTAERHRQVAHRDDREDDMATRDELTPEAVRSLTAGLIADLENMAAVEQRRLRARLAKREARNQ